MSDAIERWKPRADWTVGEVVSHEQTGAKPETDEYKQARRDALADAGLDAEGEQGDKPLEDMTPEDHFQRIRRGP
jgi:hypothetical protein